MSNTSYRVEIAKQGRATCKDGACQKEGAKIAKGELRWGTFVDSGAFQSWSWKHWGCVSGAQVQNVQEKLTKDDGTYDWDLLDGFDELKNEELEAKVKRVIQQGHIDAEDFHGDAECNVPGHKGIRLAANAKAKTKAGGKAKAKTGAGAGARAGNVASDDEDASAGEDVNNDHSAAMSDSDDSQHQDKKRKMSASSASASKMSASTHKDDDSDASDGHEDEQESVPAPLPRKRGRPRKAVKAEAPPAAKATEMVVAPKGNRGRPRKATTQPSPAVEDAEDDATDAQPIALAAPVAKRSRGRPRKHAVAQPAAQTDDDVAAEPVQAASADADAPKKRGRGRPRKIAAA